jgi:glycosyltransferase involved in cell wall biosynthesis
MSLNMPSVSVVIPTHNRANSLQRTLDALCLQTYPVEYVEVLVVADGCTDGTVEMLRSYQAPFTLHIIEQKGQGAAAARNCGAAYATGSLLLFLDDDVVPTPPLIEAHVHIHQYQPGQVVMGPYPPVLEGRTDFVHIQTRLWWGAKFQAIRQPHHRYTYRDMLSGNFSLETKLFNHLGGFDATIKGCGGEDYEFGMRLIKAGVSLTSTAEALAHHYEHETTDLDRSFRRSRQEGRAEVQIGRRHPELRSTLRLACFEVSGSLIDRTFRKLALERPGAGDYLTTHLRRMLDLLERLRLRGFWLRLYGQLFSYWYWRGVGDELDSRRALASFLQGGPAHIDESGCEIELDLREGLAATMQRLDEERPSSVRLRYGQHIVGRIPPQPGAERLRGVHLRPILATQFAWPLVKAIAIENTFGATTVDDQVLRACSLHSLGGEHAQESS